MLFRGKDWASIQLGLGSHAEEAALEHRGEIIPMTINICTPPAVAMVAATGFVHDLVPQGTDELGIAGGLQGSPVEICKAKTVDAYAIAQSEWVIEGYINPTERIWETEEAEKIGSHGVAPMFPEWPGYLGRAMKAFKFQATAITHRSDKPIFFTPLAQSFEGHLAGAPLKRSLFLGISGTVSSRFSYRCKYAAWGSRMGRPYNIPG